MDILIIDDERDFLADFRDWARFSDADVNVLTADSAPKALEMLRTVEVDLVMTDLRMPEMDGHEFLKTVKQRYPKLPVIVMTAGGTPATEQMLRDSGAAEYLEKPLNLGTIIQTMRSVQLAVNPA